MSCTRVFVKFTHASGERISRVLSVPRVGETVVIDNYDRTVRAVRHVVYNSIYDPADIIVELE